MAKVMGSSPITRLRCDRREIARTLAPPGGPLQRFFSRRPGYISVDPGFLGKETQMYIGGGVITLIIIILLLIWLL
jgi:hypothetical protein